MEILIPGLILVALMVYASTKIKRRAAEAFEAETIETDEFIITKPDGFIIPTGKDREFAFAAYSKEFGTEEADAIRQLAVELKVLDDNVENVRNSICGKDIEVLSEQRLTENGEILETRNYENGVGIETEHRLIEKNGRVFHLAIRALVETKWEQQRNIDTLIAGFEVK